MFAAALLASLLAQAEQAPPPGPAEPAPPVAAPAAPPASPAPAPPAPPAAQPPSNAAPASPPAVAEWQPALPANSVSVHFRYAYRVGAAGDSVVPAAGMSIGGEFERRYGAFQNGLELGIAFEFFYDRFSKDVIAGGTNQDPIIVSQALQQTSFALMQTIAWRYADMRLFAGIGAGLGFGFFGSGTPSDVSTTSTQPLARGVLGFDFAISKLIAAILRVDYNRSFNHESYTLAGVSYPLFGDIFEAGIGLRLHF